MSGDRQAWLEQAIAHHQAGRLDRAVPLYRQVLADDPTQADALHLLGLAAHQEGRGQEAIELIGRAIGRQPANPVFLANLGSALQSAGRLEEAEKNLRKAVGIHPGYATGHFNLGNLQRARGRLEDAEAAYRRALELAPEQAAAALNLALVLRDQGRRADALALAREVVAREPDLPQGHDLLGNLLQEDGALDEACGAYDRALTLDPGLASAMTNKGRALAALGDQPAAVASYRRALEIEPDFAPALNLLGAALHGHVELDREIGYYNRALAADPAHERARFFRGVVCDLLGDPEAARDHFARLEGPGGSQHFLADGWRYATGARSAGTRILASARETLLLGLQAAARDGLVLEFGVRFGTSIRFLARHAGQEVHGFDSFEGLPEAWGENPRGVYSTGGSLPEVPDNVRLHVGWFEDSLPGFLAGHPEPVRFINVDCDIYSSTRTVLEQLAGRIGAGTVIVFDEYFCNAGWRQDEFKAFQEAVAANGWRYRYLAFNPHSKQAVVRLV